MISYAKLSTLEPLWGTNSLITSAPPDDVYHDRHSATSGRHLAAEALRFMTSADFPE